MDPAAASVASRAVENQAILERIMLHGGVGLVQRCALVSKEFHSVTQSAQVWDQLRMQLPAEHQRQFSERGTSACERYRQCWESLRLSGGRMRLGRHVDLEVEGDGQGGHSRTKLPYRVSTTAFCGQQVLVAASDGQIRGFNMAGRIERKYTSTQSAAALDAAGGRWVTGVFHDGTSRGRRSSALLKVWDVQSAADTPCSVIGLPDFKVPGSSLTLQFFQPTAASQPPPILVGSAQRDRDNFCYATVNADGSTSVEKAFAAPSAALASARPTTAVPYLGAPSADDSHSAFFCAGSALDSTIGVEYGQVHIPPNPRYHARTHSHSLILYRMFG
jgi:hypothetical protein